MKKSFKLVYIYDDGTSYYYDFSKLSSVYKAMRDALDCVNISQINIIVSHE